MKKRNYDDTYLQYGFTCISKDNKIHPLCLICNECLASESLKPSKLKRHLDSKHPTYADKSIDCFIKLYTSFTEKRKSFESQVYIQKTYLRASYELSYLIANNGYPYTAGEKLILPSAVKISEIICGGKYRDDIENIPLSNDTVGRRIADISNDQLDQLISRIKASPMFSIQLDETTDITKLAQLMVYVRYTFEENIHEDFLFCRPLESYTSGEAIFKKINEFFEVSGLEWKNCVGVCTDGAAAMTGRVKGLKALIQSVISTPVTFTHCMIHREALVSKNMSNDLNVVLLDAVAIINFIKSSSLNSRLFMNLCDTMDSEYSKLLLHTEIRWLSKGRCLTRLLLLKIEVALFLQEKKSKHAEFFQNKEWLVKLSYLSDIFLKLNELNLSLQGKHYFNKLV